MTGWTITCDKGGSCGASIDANGLAHFPENTGTNSITYTIRYTDDDGNCGSTTIIQPGGCSSGGGGDECKAIKVTPSSTEQLEAEGGSLGFSHGASPEPEPPVGGEDTYINIVLKNTSSYDIKIIGKVKFMILPPAGSANGVAQVYFKQKNENLYCTDITVPANGTKTLNHDDMIYEGSYAKAGWPEGQSWPSVVGHLDEYKGGEISKNNTGGGNTDQLYVYTYLNMYPGTGTGEDNNSVIKTSLVGPQTFDGGSEGDIKTYTINISIDNQTTFWCKNN